MIRRSKNHHLATPRGSRRGLAVSALLTIATLGVGQAAIAGPVAMPAAGLVAQTAAEPFPGAVVDDSLVILGQFEVDGDNILGSPPADQLAIWTRFAELFPAAIRPEVEIFVPIDAEASNGIDGAMQTFDFDNTRYYMALATDGSVAPAELDRTMIHEFAHLLSLRTSQIPRDDNADATNCATYLTGDGCAPAGSYLAEFVAAFWPGQVEDPTDGDAETRFNASTDTYVTEYAATNQSEDLAETFAEWVLAATSPTGETVVQQKLRFFDDFPAAVELRAGIRLRMGLDQPATTTTAAPTTTVLEMDELPATGPASTGSQAWIAILMLGVGATLVLTTRRKLV